MHRWMTELTSLMVCVSLGNPKGLKALHSASMDGSSATVNQLPDSFYEDLLVGFSIYCVQARSQSMAFCLASYRISGALT